jgi:hypothetical protein
MISPQVEWDHLRRLRAERLAQGAERTARAAHAVAAIPQSCDPAPVSIEIEARELTAPRLAACLREHGCALIRGLIPTDITAQVRSLIDHVFNAADHGPASSDLYDPLLDLATMKPDDRKWVRSGGAVLTADSPRALNDVAGLLTQFGLVDLSKAILGVDPLLSCEKLALRRTDPDADFPAVWHQDGAFLGQDTRSVNFWIALTPAGIDRPGIEIMPMVCDQILPTGTPGSLHAWDIAPDQVRAHFGGQESWTPAFNPGDVLIFDHMSVHRTHQSPDMREVRYALECWTFAPDHFPNTQTPVALSFA